MSEFKWWQNTIIYEIYPSSFKDTSGNGYGDLKGVVSKLDYLKSLNVGAIWLTPVYKSPMVDNGYDVADYYDINPLYGDMKDMDELLLEANNRNIKVIMDLVYNHTSDQNEWFIESRKSKDNPKSDWYIWRDPKPDGSAPTNWRCFFGGSAWSYDEKRKQYYLHTFAKEQPDLNWANPEVRNELYRVGNYWLDKGVSGFRIDAITYIKKPEIFADAKVDGEDGLGSIYEPTSNIEGILDYLREFKEKVFDGHDIVTIAEANGVPEQQLVDWVGSKGIFDMMIQFNHTDSITFEQGNWCKPLPWNLVSFKKALDSSLKGTSQYGWYPVFLENHDRPRSVNTYVPDYFDHDLACKLLATMILCQKGTPLLYQGQEIGMSNVNWDKIEMYNDVQTITQYHFCKNEGFDEESVMKAVKRFSRDNARTPMQWDTSHYAGFSDNKPWLMVNENYASINVLDQQGKEKSVLNYYRKLSSFRLQHSSLLQGDYLNLLPEDLAIYGFKREYKGESIVVLLNFSNEMATYDTALVEGYQCCNSTYDSAIEKGVLRPLEAIIFKLSC